MRQADLTVLLAALLAQRFDPFGVGSMPLAGSADANVPVVTRRAKVLERLLAGTADVGFGFDELCALLRAMGFSERRSGGSHHIFIRDGVAEILNLQPRGGDAKPYQVRQVRDVVLKYKLFATLVRDRTTPETDDEA